MDRIRSRIYTCLLAASLTKVWILLRLYFSNMLKMMAMWWKRERREDIKELATRRMICLSHLSHIVVDCTCGNGHDSFLLAHRLFIQPCKANQFHDYEYREDSQLLCIDKSLEAIKNTKMRLGRLLSGKYSEFMDKNGIRNANAKRLRNFCESICPSILIPASRIVHMCMLLCY